MKPPRRYDIDTFPPYVTIAQINVSHYTIRTPSRNRAPRQLCHAYMLYTGCLYIVCRLKGHLCGNPFAVSAQQKYRSRFFLTPSACNNDYAIFYTPACTSNSPIAHLEGASHESMMNGYVHDRTIIDVTLQRGLPIPHNTVWRGIFLTELPNRDSSCQVFLLRTQSYATFLVIHTCHVKLPIAHIEGEIGRTCQFFRFKRKVMQFSRPNMQDELSNWTNREVLRPGAFIKYFT